MFVYILCNFIGIETICLINIQTIRKSYCYIYYEHLFPTRKDTVIPATSIALLSPTQIALAMDQILNIDRGCVKFNSLQGKLQLMCGPMRRVIHSGIFFHIWILLLYFGLSGLAKDNL